MFYLGQKVLMPFSNCCDNKFILEKMTRLVPVILSGGAGTRLWPLSRSSYPKQFIEFKDGRTLFQYTVERVNGLMEARSPIVVSNREYIHLVRQNLQDLNLEATLISEPESKNTAPAIALASFVALKEDPDVILLVLPSDHVINGIEPFKKAIENAIEQAKLGAMVTFGIEPTSPETGFGYIQRGKSIGSNCFEVEKFVEKPCQEYAQAMINEGGVYWNSGIFMFKAQTFIDELRKYANEIYERILSSLENGYEENSDSKFKIIFPHENEFRACPSNSIDYALMEKTKKVSLIPLSIDWNDMGTWTAFYHLGDKDDKKNVIQGDVVTMLTEGCYINSTNRLITAVGVKDLAIVETTDAVFVSPLDRVQEAKEIVNRLKLEDRPEVESSTVVHRPWGIYEVLASGECYQVKRIAIRPGEQLSLQLHHHRVEHWIIVEGNPEIRVGQITRSYSANEFVYIPKKCLHRLSNHTNNVVVIIEIQYGNYLGEDDIERFEDKYYR